jgi:hypothetical protein
MIRLHPLLLIFSTIIASWLGMQAVHELGHVLGALMTDGHVTRVVLHPLTISRTDVFPNPQPLVVVWMGPLFGILFPLALWAAAAVVRMPGAFVLRFFAGFCLIANGAYISAASFDQVGDSGEMLRHGSSLWQLWSFGAVTVPIGFWLWHRQGPHFGLGKSAGQVDRGVAYGTSVAALLLIALGLSVGGE